MANIDKTLLVEYDLFDVLAAGDATCITSTGQSFSSISELPVGTNFSNYGTMEHNFFVLDGNTVPFPDSPEPIAFYSSSMSNENGEFEVNPFIEISFTENHSSVALTFEFVDDYPIECELTFKTLMGTTLYKNRLSFTDLKCSLESHVFNYGYIKIEFTKTLPHRYVKLNKLTFGKTLVWNESTVISGNLVEELSHTSEKLSINTLDFSVFDEEDTYNMGNKGGYHKYIQAGQEIRPYMANTDSKLYLGKFFIDSFSDSNFSANFHCIDLLGIMDKFTYYKGSIYSGELAGVIIEELMRTCGIDNYVIDDATYNHPIYGALKPMTCREALTKILFSCQSIADTSKKDHILIRRPTTVITSRIMKDRKISTKVTRKKYVSGIEVKYETHKLSTERSEILSEVYPSGENLIQFDTPYKDIETSVGIILESGTFYCILKLDEQSSVTLTGLPYESTETTVRNVADHVDSGEIENIISYGVVLSNLDGSKEICKSLKRYNDFRLQLDIKYLAENENLCDWNIVQNPNSLYNNYIAGFESINTDLVGGFISVSKLVGYYDITSGQYFAGTDIYANDNVII